MRFSVRHELPPGLDRVQWRELRDISRAAFKAELPNRTPEEVDALVGWGEFDRFYESHLDPNVEVGRRYNAHQEYRNPGVAIATVDSGRAVGWAYGASNASGESATARQIKFATVKAGGLVAVKNYFWIREVAVSPEARGQGVARTLLRHLLSQSAAPIQPVTAYTWPDELDVFPEFLNRLGFRPTGEQMVEVFGPGSRPTRQVRMLAPSAKSVLDKLA